MKQHASFLWLFMPFSIFLLLTIVMVIERSGISYASQPPSLRLLGVNDAPLRSSYTEPPVESLVLYDSSQPADQPVHQNVVDALQSMRVRYTEMDVNNPVPPDYGSYATVVVTFHNLDLLPQANTLVDWTKGGGRVLFATRPFITQSIYSIYRKIGIQSLEDRNVVVQGLTFADDFMPGSNGLSLIGGNGFLVNYSYPLALEASSRVYLTSADQYKLPLLWSTDYGSGRFVVFNTNQMADRMNRGILSAAYGLLQDVSVYPVINSSVFFIDDFPSPMPAGENPRITGEYHRTIGQFFTEVWWPDMRQLAAEHGAKYTGLLVESFNETVNLPYPQSFSVDDHRYYGRSLLRSGGEIGLEGYNHVPLCVAGEGVNEATGYPGWASRGGAVLAAKAMQDFAHEIFPGQSFSVYVPPANILCPEARQWLPEVLPEIRMISGLWNGTGEPPAYLQDFREASDGIVEFPIVGDGYTVYENIKLAILNELGLHYVNSHYIHPYDLLNEKYEAGRTWAELRNDFGKHLDWLEQSTPGLRNMTAKQAATAAQRFYRLKVNARMEGNQYTIQLGGFYDEASLMLRSSREPVKIEGGKITKVTSSLYLIQADRPEIRITFGK
jgi:hypothetical protein